MSTVIGIVIFVALAFWLGYEVYSLIKQIKRRKAEKNKEKSELKTDNSNGDNKIKNDGSLK